MATKKTVKKAPAAKRKNSMTIDLRALCKQFQELSAGKLERAVYGEIQRIFLQPDTVRGATESPAELLIQKEFRSVAHAQIAKWLESHPEIVAGAVERMLEKGAVKFFGRALERHFAEVFKEFEDGIFRKIGDLKYDNGGI